MHYWVSVNAGNDCVSSMACGQKKKLCPLDEFKVLVKLKHDSANKDLAESFTRDELKHDSANKDLAESFTRDEFHVSQVFVSCIKLLHVVLSSRSKSH